MATIIGGLMTSHVPAIGGAIARGAQQEPYWKPFFDGFLPAQGWLAEQKPDVAVIFYNDHGLNFFLDKMPTFAVGAAPEYRNADEGWGIPTLPPIAGVPDLSWHIVEHLMERDFDIVTCQEMLIDHACSLPMKLFWPNGVGLDGVETAAHRPALLLGVQGDGVACLGAKGGSCAAAAARTPDWLPFTVKR